MRKKTIHSAILLALIACGFGLIYPASSQSSNQNSLKVLDYSWYFDSIGGFHIVGEIQNVGNTILNPVVLGGTIYTPDGTAQILSNPCTVYVNYMLPQQKAAFLMDFPFKDMSWMSQGIDHAEFTVIMANSTNTYQYPDLSITSSSTSIDVTDANQGVYWVSGRVQNTGNRTANNVRVIAAFYNSTNNIVAAGYSEELAPIYIDPSLSASFKVGATDVNMTIVIPDRNITRYTLYLQTLGPLLSGTPPPPTSSSGSSSDPSAPSDNSASNDNSSNPETSGLNYAAAVAVVVIVIVVAVFLMYKRSSSRTKVAKSSESKAVGRRRQPHRRGDNG